MEAGHHVDQAAAEPAVDAGALAPGAKRQRRTFQLGLSLLLLAAAGLIYWARSTADDPRAEEALVAGANTRVFVCTVTGRSFPYKAKEGETEPIESPFTGRKTAWAAEPCYWTRDGKAKREPTYVVLKERMGINEKTICPNCGREVVGHNPLPPPELFKTAQ